jgi:hypothetical protein
MKFLSDIRLLLVAIWLGAALFFIAVAQSAFAVLPQREMAGLVVSRTLAILNLSGIALFVVLLLLSFVGSKAANRVMLWTERVLLLATAVACAVGQFVFGFWIAMKRAEIGRPIDELAVDDPLRIQFNMLHEYSVWTLMFGMATALLAFFAIANRKVGAAKNDPRATPYNFEKEFKI